MEFYDLFLQSGNPMPQEAMLKIIDRSGKIMVMRPDCTTPIARVAATKLKAVPLPQRLYYDQTVFRSGQAHKGGSSEIAQCGVELIGAAGRKADLEMVALAVDALRACGGSSSTWSWATRAFSGSWPAGWICRRRQSSRCAPSSRARTSPPSTTCWSPTRDRPACAALQRLSRLFGGAEVLDEAETLAGAAPCWTTCGSCTTSCSQAGYGDYIRFDLGMVHQIDYYTGVVFRGYVEGAGDAVLSGGRYDNLVGAFGRPAPATGFAVDVDAVAGCLPARRPPGWRR